MNILVYNRKGGCGKSFISDELMFSFERSGQRTALIDLDEQGTLIHPDTSEQADEAEVTIIDTPGALSSELPQWISDSDLLVIPTNPDPRDITPLMAALEAAREYGPEIPRIVMVNRYSKYRLPTQFLNSLKNVREEGETITTITQSEAVRRAFIHRNSVVDEDRNSMAAYSLLKSVNAVREAGGYAPDPVDPEAIMKELERRAANERTRREIRRGY